MSPSRRIVPWPCLPPVLTPRAPSPCAPSCGLAVGRDVPIAPPRLGAVRGFASRALVARTARTPWCGPVAVGRDAWPPLPVAARHRSTRLCIVHTLRVLHAVACQRGLPARDTVRGRDAQPARCHNRAAITHGALPGRRDRDIAPYRHYTRNIRTPHSHGRGVRLATLPARALHARRGSRPRAVPLGGVRGAIPVDVRRSPSPPSPSRAAWHPAKFARALPTTTGRCGAMGTSRPTAITHAHYPRTHAPRGRAARWAKKKHPRGARMLFCVMRGAR